MRINEHVSSRIYTFLLHAYPSDFRDEYGWLMTQAFRDRYREEASHRRKWAIITYWFSVLGDLVVTATKEHGENFGKDSLMNRLHRDSIALLGTIVILGAALALHRWIVISGRSGAASSIFYLGYALDAMVTAGVIGNLIVFLLVKFTKWDSLRIALWTFVIVHATLLTIIAILGPSIGPFNIGPPLIGYVVSFAFWFGLHWAWRSMRSEVTIS